MTAPPLSDTESFRDKPLLWGVAISLLWHFFWFFSITITVGPGRFYIKPKPKAVSLGPVLDDDIFRSLVATKPQLSETFYRRLSDFSEAAPEEPPVKTIERHAPGDVVSVPFGKRLMNSLKNLVGGDKASPEYEFVTSRLKTGYADEVAGLEGEAKNREILNRPRAPKFPEDLDPSWRDSEVEIEFVVDAPGSVSAVHVIGSSGNPAVDALWLHYIRRWQFTPFRLGKASVSQKGKIKLRFN